MALDIGALAGAMIGAAKGKLKKQFPVVKEFVASEARKTAETLAMIERLRLTGDISPTEAKLLFEMQRNSAKAVLMTVEGLGLLAAESAINAAVGAVRTTVNKAVGFTLI